MNESDKILLIVASLLKEILVMTVIFIILFMFFSLRPDTDIENTNTNISTWSKFILHLGALNVMVNKEPPKPVAFSVMFLLYYATTFLMVYLNTIQPPRKSKRNKSMPWWDYILTEFKHRISLILFGPAVLFVFFSILFGLLKTTTSYNWEPIFKSLSMMKRFALVCLIMLYLYVMIELVYAWLINKPIFPTSQPEFNFIRVIFLYPTLLILAILVFIFLFLTKSSQWISYLFSLTLILYLCLLILCMVFLIHIFYFFDMPVFTFFLILVVLLFYFFYTKQNTT